VPTGVLALLPLHAATARDDSLGPDVAASDIVISYTPTVTALHRSRAVSTTRRKRHALVVGPSADDPRPLPAARAEAARIAALLGVPVLAGDAVREQLLAALPSCTWLHLAVHARFDADEPVSSDVLLGEHESVSVAEIGALRTRAAELAFLSACETTQTNPALTDEAVHLRRPSSWPGSRRSSARNGR
jgi:CHAT domain-containing protein